MRQQFERPGDRQPDKVLQGRPVCVSSTFPLSTRFSTMPETHRYNDPPCGQVISAVFNRPGTLPQQHTDQRRSREQGERVDEPIHHAVRDIRVLVPNMTLGDQTPEIAPDRIPGPSEDLLQEPPVRLHRGQEFGLFADLHVSVPPVADHPSGEKLVVPRVQVILAHPKVVRETVDEFGVLENDGTVGSRPSGQTRNSTIDMGRARDFNVPDRQSESGQDFPNGHPFPARLDPLTRPDTTDLLILETSEGVGQERGRPDGIVIGKDDNVGRRVPDPVHHLETLVRQRDGQHADLVRVHRVGQLLKRALHGLLGDDDDLLGIPLEPRKGGLYTTTRRGQCQSAKRVRETSDPPLNSSPASMVGTIIVTSSLAIYVGFSGRGTGR